MNAGGHQSCDLRIAFTTAMRMGFVSLIMLVFSASFVLAQDMIADMQQQLVTGPFAGQDKQVNWVFDENSGFTLGDGFELDCMKGDLAFIKDGSIDYGGTPPKARECLDGETGRDTGMTWKIQEDKSTSVIQLAISYYGENCLFDIFIISVPATGGEKRSGELVLTTMCRQLPGQPRQFRYFLDEPHG